MSDPNEVIALAVKGVSPSAWGLALQIEIAKIVGKRSDWDAFCFVSLKMLPVLATAIKKNNCATLFLSRRELDILRGYSVGTTPGNADVGRGGSFVRGVVSVEVAAAAAKVRTNASGGKSRAKPAALVTVKSPNTQAGAPTSGKSLGLGVIQPYDGANVYNIPDSSKGTKTPYARNTPVFVCRELPGDWYLVRVLTTGELGYVHKVRIWTGAPDPDAYLYRIKKGQGAQEIAKQEFLEQAKRKPGSKPVNWGMDWRHYVRSLVYANHLGTKNGTGARGIYYTGKDEDWAQTRTTEGVDIWIPGLSFAQSLQGKLPQDSKSYKMYRAVVDHLGSVGEFLLGRIAFEAGILHGALQSVWDTLVGLVEIPLQIWSVLKSTFTGDFWAFLKELWQWVDNLSRQLLNELLQVLKDFIKGLVNDFIARWNSENFLRKWHFRGWVVGYIIAETMMAVFTEGVTLATWVGRAAKLIAFLKRFPKLKVFIDKVMSTAQKLSHKIPPGTRAKLKKALKEGAPQKPANSTPPNVKKGGAGPEASNKTGGKQNPQSGEPNTGSNGTSKPRGENTRNKTETPSSGGVSKAPDGTNTRSSPETRLPDGASQHPGAKKKAKTHPGRKNVSSKPTKDSRQDGSTPQVNNKADGQGHSSAHGPVDITKWPPEKPNRKVKPKVGGDGAAEWRYNKYRYDRHREGKQQDEILDFDTYKRRHYNVVLKGGRPGCPGGKDQQATRKMLAAKEGFTNAEKRIGPSRRVDAFKTNEQGGTDYVEVDKILKTKGVPGKSYQQKLREQVALLKKNDRLIFVDATDPSKRIIYRYGDSPDVVKTRTWEGFKRKVRK
ncbi:hypothetical protein F0U62_16995 [Cystobacter fuscus]|uniref:hypothetical protein n=1 Tax=Cystobacter fuscus TaxID=43 RepID=UPI002B322585|nr:hypothetical protein F0U62_16995 [Cystobacter fuscus]